MEKWNLKGKAATGLVFLMILAVSYSCNSSKTLRGGAIGAGAGGILGGIIGSKSDNTATGAIIGAAVGGTAGALIGKYMDKQAEELRRDLDGAKVERIGEGIKITFDSGILFGFDSSELTSASKVNISELAKTLKKYEDTEILIEGHTDSQGTEEYNQELSERRTASVSSQLKNLEVSGSRISEVGYGEMQPVADNSTKEGRSQNRRVEVAIYANNKLKKAADNTSLKN